MEIQYQRTVWLLPDDFDSEVVFRRMLLRLDNSSSPGYPYCREASTVGEWLGSDGIWYDEVKIQRLWHDVKHILEEQDEEMILRVFIKEEPHSAAKIEEERFRLIQAFPLAWQMIWHMLFSYQNDLEIVNAYHIPSQQGIRMYGGGWRQFRDQWVARGFCVGYDKSAWDWNMAYWTIMWELEFRRRMGRGRRMEYWHQLARWAYRVAFEKPKLVLSDGTLIQQRVPGVMKSGCVSTISINGHGQYIVEGCEQMDELGDIEELDIVAVGDDTLSKRMVADVSIYSKYGAVIKSATLGLEFLGHDFRADGPYPLYLAKHMRRFMSMPDERVAEYLDSMLRMYCHDEKLFNVWMSLALALGFQEHTCSREAYLLWYDHE